MSLPQECGWTLLRALAVALAAWPVCVLLSGWLTAEGRSRMRWGLCLLLLPFLTPGFVVGYAYSYITLQLVRHPLLNELFYDLLLLFQVVPVGTLVLLLAPPAPLGPMAGFCRRLAGHKRLSRVGATAAWRLLLQGNIRNHLPAVGLMSLLAFHEFEIASLSRVIAGRRISPPSWTNALFESVALQGLGQNNPNDLLARAWLPLACSVLLLTPLLLLLRNPGRAEHAERHPARPRGNALQQVAARGWLLAAIVVVTLVPLGSLLAEAVPSFTGGGPGPLAAVAAHAGRSLLLAVAVFIPVVVAAAVLLWHFPRALLWLSLPGLLGSLALGLLLTWVFLQPGLRELRSSAVPVMLGEAIWLMPRVVLVMGLVALYRPRQDYHLSRLLQAAASRRRRTSGWRVCLKMQGRAFLVVGGLACWWCYLELTLNELLAPPQLLSVAHKMYQQMHFGRVGMLSAQTLVTISVPLGFVGLMILWDLFCPVILFVRRRAIPLDGLGEDAE